VHELNFEESIRRVHGQQRIGFGCDLLQQHNLLNSIVFEGVSHTYTKPGGGDVVALDGVSATFEPGACRRVIASNYVGTLCR